MLIDHPPPRLAGRQLAAVDSPPEHPKSGPTLTPLAPAVPRPAHRARRPALGLLIDLIAPIVLYYGLRSAGASIYLALIVGAVAPALSATINAFKHRRVDGLAVAVLAMLVVSTCVSLIGGSPRFLVAKDSLLTAAWGAWFIVSLHAQRPLTFRFTRPLLEGRKVFDPATRKRAAPTTQSWDELWEQEPRFRRAWRVTTLIWGAAMGLDAALRVIMASTLPADLVPGLAGALWPVTFIALQVITNVYFVRCGLWLILLGKAQPRPQARQTVPPEARPRER
jgi:hypothetical protein